MPNGDWGDANVCIRLLTVRKIGGFPVLPTVWVETK
jgi:hypothetical protein